MKINKKNVGHRIKEKRSAKGLSQMVFSEMLDTSTSCVSRIERGDRLPSLELLMQISELLGCSCDELLTGHQVFQTNMEDDVTIAKIIDLCKQGTPIEKELIHQTASAIVDTLRGWRGQSYP